jgi:hypothetical protein
MLDSSEALEHPLVKEVFHLTDRIFEDDPDIKAFFARSSAT